MVLTIDPTAVIKQKKVKKEPGLKYLNHEPNFLNKLQYPILIQG